MPKQSSAQKKTVERVMHEYKHGDLKSGSGKKVKSRKQAVAIALKESGSSKNATKAENKRNLAKTKKKESSGKIAKVVKNTKTANMKTTKGAKATPRTARRS